MCDCSSSLRRNSAFKLVAERLLQTTAIALLSLSSYLWCLGALALRYGSFKPWRRRHFQNMVEKFSHELTAVSLWRPWKRRRRRSQKERERSWADGTIGWTCLASGKEGWSGKTIPTRWCEGTAGSPGETIASTQEASGLGVVSSWNARRDLIEANW